MTLHDDLLAAVTARQERALGDVVTDHPVTPSPQEYVDRYGKTWTYWPPPRDSFTRGPAAAQESGSYAHWYVTEKWGPLIPASVVVERDNALAEVAHWKGLANEQPEPCPLDHGCDPEEVCGCWCQLHDCAIDECPTFKSVESWLSTMREQHKKIVSKWTAKHAALAARLRVRREEAISAMAEAETVIGAIWHALGIPADADADIVAEVRDLVARDKPGCSRAHEELATVEAERDNALAEVASLTAERDRLAKSLDDAVAHLADESRTVGEFGAKNLRLIGEADALRKRIHELKAENEYRRATEAGLHAERDALAARLERAEAERDAMRPVVDRALAVIEHQRPGRFAGPGWESRRDELMLSLLAAVDTYRAATP